jgi:hypothetical protein
MRLRRFLAYAQKRFDLAELLAKGRDPRRYPRISTAEVLYCVLILFLARVGSLNGLELTRETTRIWRDLLGRDLPSADTLGRVMGEIDPDSLRQILRANYAQLKRKKALEPTSHGLMALAIDGHEVQASYRRKCEGSLERQVQHGKGWRTQYYHRQVTAMLLSKDYPILLDAEMLRPGEDELGAARRLLERVLVNYPRAFDVVLGDALYSDAKTYALIVRHHKDVLSVLKKNQESLLIDAEAIMQQTQPVLDHDDGEIWHQVHDVGGFEPWAGSKKELRVVRSRKRWQVRRQIDGCKESQESHWMWTTTCTPQRATHQAVVVLGHARWDIENQGFNETVNRWHADHVYKHSTQAILNFWLMAMLAFNLFYTFCHRNLKSEVRQRYTFQHIARCLAAELYIVDDAWPEARPP